MVSVGKEEVEEQKEEEERVQIAEVRAHASHQVRLADKDMG